MNKQPEVTAAAKEKLTDAFWSLYKEKRIENITVKDITRISGYNRSTFYEYFQDVYDVLEYIEESLLEYVRVDIIGDLDFLDNEKVIEKITIMYNTKGEYFSLLLSEDGDPYFVGKFKAVMKPTMFSHLPIKESVQALYLFEFVMSAILGTITYWYQQDDETLLSDVIIMIRSILTGGAFQEMQKYISQ